MGAVHSVLSAPIDRRACIAAVCAFALARQLTRRQTAVSTNGPLVYTLQRSDSKVPWVLRRIFGDFVAVMEAEAGAAVTEWYDLGCSKCGGDAKAAVLMRSGTGTSLLLAHDVDVRHVIVERPQDFEKEETVKMLNPFTGEKGLIAIIDEDEHSRMFRLVSHVFATKHIRRVIDGVVREEVRELVAHIGETVDGASTAGAPPQGPVDISKAASDAVMQISAKLSLGFNDPQYITNLRAFLHYPLSALLALGAGFYNSLPIERNRLAAASRNDLWVPVKERVEAARRATVGDDEDDDDASPLDIVHMLGKNPAITVEEVLDSVVTFVFAGYDTTAVAVTWALLALSKAPEFQQRLYEEVSHVVPKGTVPTVDQLASCTFLTAVVRETLRVYPPVINVIRTAKKDTVLPGSGTYVPKGESLTLSMFTMHRNKKAFGADADHFRPDRWIEDQGLYERVHGRWYLPFLAGKRACLGRELALGELSVTLAAVVRNFEFMWPADQPEPKRVLVFTMQPSTPVVPTVRRRAE